MANYTNDEAKEILKELYNITDEKLLKEKYEKLQKFYEEDRPYIGLNFNSITKISGKNLTMTNDNNWFNIFLNMDKWHKKN